MMRSILKTLGLFECCRYNNEKELLDLTQKERDALESQVTMFLGQIQELKAMNNYQAFDLEKKIEELTTQLDMKNSEIKILEKEKFSLMGKLGYFKKQAGLNKKGKQ